ncbi:MAG: hypothetical protein JSR46_01830, partial [Verrucomicrobia bacterium]|nr:hypothetical protein [Verrucomicrobiota bacterium]
KGGDPNKANAQLTTPLGAAILMQNWELIYLLKQNGAIWPGLDLGEQPLSFYLLLTCKSAALFCAVLDMEERTPDDLYTEKTRTQTYLEWAFVRKSPLAIFELIRRRKSLYGCAMFESITV